MLLTGLTKNPDVAVFKGVPAPINLEVPPYKFINAHTIEIG